jgi:hypothetical protein
MSDRSYLDFALHVHEGTFWLWDCKNQRDSDLSEDDSRRMASRIACQDVSHMKFGVSWSAELAKMKARADAYRPPVESTWTVRYPANGDIMTTPTRYAFLVNDRDQIVGPPMLVPEVGDLVFSSAECEVLATGLLVVGPGWTDRRRFAFPPGTTSVAVNTSP